MSNESDPIAGAPALYTLKLVAETETETNASGAVSHRPISLLIR